MKPRLLVVSWRNKPMAAPPNTTMNNTNFLDRVCDLIFLRHCAREMGVGKLTMAKWIKERLLQPIDVLGEPMITRAQLTEFEQFARMGYYDQDRYAARQVPRGCVQTEFWSHEGGFAV